MDYRSKNPFCQGLGESIPWDKWCFCWNDICVYYFGVSELSAKEKGNAFYFSDSIQGVLSRTASKKRIVVLTKAKSKQIYLVLATVVMGVLVYSSCKAVKPEAHRTMETVYVGDFESMAPEEEDRIYSKLESLSKGSEEWKLNVVDDNGTTVRFTRSNNKNSFIIGPNGIQIPTRMSIARKNSKNFQDSNAEIGSANGVDVPFAVVEEPPIFPGCENSVDKRACFNEMMQKHIGDNFQYPEEARKKEIEGWVSIMFTIDEEGNITNVKKRGPDKLLEDEAARIISKLPKMVPGKNRGIAVRVPFSIPITFKLDGSEGN